MTTGYLISFGGILLVVALSLVIEAVLTHRMTPTGKPRDSDTAADIAASLARAERAAKEVEVELARTRAYLAIWLKLGGAQPSSAPALSSSARP